MVLDDSSDESAAGLVDRGIPFARGVRHSPGGEVSSGRASVRSRP